jgi:hypothetical protein
MVGDPVVALAAANVVGYAIMTIPEPPVDTPPLSFAFPPPPPRPSVPAVAFPVEPKL